MYSLDVPVPVAGGCQFAAYASSVEDVGVVEITADSAIYGAVGGVCLARLHRAIAVEHAFVAVIVRIAVGEQGHRCVAAVRVQRILRRHRRQLPGTGGLLQGRL